MLNRRDNFLKIQSFHHGKCKWNQSLQLKLWIIELQIELGDGWASGSERIEWKSEDTIDFRIDSNHN